MNKLSLLIVVLFAVSNAQHKIPFASKNNVIELSVANSATISAGTIDVEIVNPPEWITFTNKKVQIENFHSGVSSTARYSFSIDKFAPVGKDAKLQFMIRSQAGEKWTKEISIQVAAPENYELFQNYPNPFNPSTKIDFSIPQEGVTTLKVYDAIGREVSVLMNETKDAGYYSVSMDASKLSSGIYIYKLTSGSFSQIKKMILVK